MNDNQVRFSLRMSSKLNSDLKTLADEDMRSLNMYIVKVLEKHVKENYEMLMNKYSNPNLNAVAEPTQSYIPQINLPEQETYDKSLADNSDPNELVGQYTNKHKKTQD